MQNAESKGTILKRSISVGAYNYTHKHKQNKPYS